MCTNGRHIICHERGVQNLLLLKSDDALCLSLCHLFLTTFDSCLEEELKTNTKSYTLVVNEAAFIGYAAVHPFAGKCVINVLEQVVLVYDAVCNAATNLSG